MGLLRNMTLTAMQSTDKSTRMEAGHQLVDAITAAEKKAKGQQLPVEYVFITVDGKLVGLTKQQYVSVFHKLYFSDNKRNTNAVHEGRIVIGDKIKAIQMLRTIGNNNDAPIALKAAKIAVENVNNFPQPIDEYQPLGKRS